jgi:hypothetical protein
VPSPPMARLSKLGLKVVDNFVERPSIGVGFQVIIPFDTHTSIQTRLRIDHLLSNG